MLLDPSEGSLPSLSTSCRKESVIGFERLPASRRNRCAWPAPKLVFLARIPQLPAVSGRQTPMGIAGKEKPDCMNCKAGAISALLCLAVVLQPGCAANRPGKDSASASIVSQQLVKSTRSWDGKLLPPYPAGQPEVTIRRLSIPPGARLETHLHPVINAGVLVKGELTVVSRDGKRLRLKVGDPIVELVNTPHFGINEGRIPAVIIVVHAGTVGKQTTVGASADRHACR
jgi:quercetin dioxygenase-like cupin family protein